MSVGGMIHLYTPRKHGVNLLSPGANDIQDLARFEFIGPTELDVIEMLEQVLATLRTRYAAHYEVTRPGIPVMPNKGPKFPLVSPPADGGNEKDPDEDWDGVGS